RDRVRTAGDGERTVGTDDHGADRLWQTAVAIESITQNPRAVRGNGHRASDLRVECRNVVRHPLTRLDDDQLHGEGRRLKILDGDIAGPVAPARDRKSTRLNSSHD